MPESHGPAPHASKSPCDDKVALNSDSCPRVQTGGWPQQCSSTGRANRVSQIRNVGPHLSFPTSFRNVPGLITLVRLRVPRGPSVGQTVFSTQPKTTLSVKLHSKHFVPSRPAPTPVPSTPTARSSCKPGESQQRSRCGKLAPSPQRLPGSTLMFRSAFPLNLVQ